MLTVTLPRKIGGPYRGPDAGFRPEANVLVTHTAHRSARARPGGTRSYLLTGGDKDNPSSIPATTADKNFLALAMPSDSGRVTT